MSLENFIADVHQLFRHRFQLIVGIHGLLHICVVQPTAAAKILQSTPAWQLEATHIKNVSRSIVKWVLPKMVLMMTVLVRGVQLTKVEQRCCCLAWSLAVFCELPVLPPVSNLWTRTKVTKHRNVLLGILNPYFSHMGTHQCDGVL